MIIEKVNARMLTMNETMNYLKLSRNTVVKICSDIGALKKIGNRVLIDRNVLDRAIDENHYTTEYQTMTRVE
jgi:hypothetical protein